jgi:hypothetical protein
MNNQLTQREAVEALDHWLKMIHFFDTELEEDTFMLASKDFCDANGFALVRKGFDNRLMGVDGEVSGIYEENAKD